MLLDSVHIFLPREFVPDFSLIDKLPNRFPNCSIYTKNGIVSYSGYLDNMYWVVRNNGLFISGSLSKYVFGNNYTNLNQEMCLYAIESLSQRFGVSLMTSKLTQIDFGISFECDHKPTRYFKYLGTSKYFKSRSVNSSTLTYSNSSRRKEFYDKIKELKKNGATLPAELLGKKMIRFEVRYRNDPFKYFNRGKLFIQDLFFDGLYDELKLKINEEFESIERVRHSTLDTSQVKKASDFKSFIAADALADKGLPTYLALIEECDGLDTQNKSRAKAYCKELSRSFINDRGTDLYDELTEKFNATLNKL